ncbi:MAG: hypothetical protein Q8J99_13695 [Sulfuritalea sp.]|nr:hypothetical protein [Sulfuritalea sp.]
MVFDISVAMTWILFLALFPITFFWMRRVWRVAIRKDYSEVALKRGESPTNPAKYAPYATAINLTGSAALIYAVFGVVSGSLAYETWSAIAGSTIWLKLILDFALSRHAHFKVDKKKSATAAGPVKK